MKKKISYFTLIELIVVIVILSVLAAIVIPSVQDMKKDAITSMVTSNTRILQTAVDKYALDHNGKLPSTIEPTLKTPQVIDMELLHEKYLRSEIDYNKLKEQKYWVDIFGTVWGATVDSPDNLIQSEKGLEFAQREKAEAYRIYKVTDSSNAGKASKAGLKEVSTFKVNEKAERIFVNGDYGDYLISTVDEYGLESAPAGLNYLGYQQDWFTPLIKKSGTFEFEMKSKDTMYWDDFRTLQDTPVGTSIEFLFSVLGEDGKFTSETHDFYSLPPSKEIKVKVIMKGTNQHMPTLMDMRIFYHFEKITKVKTTKVVSQNLSSFEESTPAPTEIGIPSMKKEAYTTNPSQPTVVIDEFIVPEKVVRIENTDSYSPFFIPKVSYLVKKPDGSTQAISSFEEMTPGMTVQVKREYPQGTVFVGTPSIGFSNGGGTYSFNPETREGKLIGEGSSSQPVSEWETISTQNFFASSGDGQSTDWISAEIEDVKPEGTKIDYTYMYSNSNQLGEWSGSYSSIEEVPNSKAILVQAKLMVKTAEKDKVSPPSVTKIRITHLRGDVIAEPIDNISDKVGSSSIQISAAGREAAFDGKDETYVSHPVGTYYYDLQGDATNRTLRLLASTTGYFGAVVQLVDEFDRPIYTVSSTYNTKTYQFDIANPNVPTEIKTRIPEGAKRIKVVVRNTGTSGSFKMHEIQIMSDYPTSLGTVNHTNTDSSITMNWNMQTPATRILIFENNKLVGNVSANTFVHTPLLSNSQHTYQIVPIHENGAVGLDTYYIANTDSRPITWSGIGAAAFDRDMNSFAYVHSKSYATWDGNLKGKTIYIKAEQSGVYKSRISLKDANNVSLVTINGVTGGINSGFDITGMVELALKVPDNAVKVEIDSYATTSGTGFFKIYEIEERSPEGMAISGLSANTTDSSVTLNWNNPTTSNFKQVVVHKSNVIKTRTSTNQYTETPLYSNSTHTYIVHPVAQNYAVGESLTVTATTKARSTGIQWSGIGPALFDKDSSTYAYLSGTNTHTVTWSGNLDSQTLYIKASQGGVITGNIAFKNSSNQKLLTVDGISGIKTTTFTVSGDKEFALQIPVGAVKLDFETSSTSGSGYFQVFEVQERFAEEMTITNLGFTSTETTLTLNWNNPYSNDFDKVAVYKGNTFKGFKTTGSFIETNLYSDTTYDYTLYSIAKNGFVGKPFNISAKTQPRPSGIQWSGIGPEAFDRNINTYAHAGTSLRYVTWTGDLTGKTVTITAEVQGVYSGDIRFYNSSGALVSMTNLVNNSTTTAHRINGKQVFKFVMPSNVTKIGFNPSVSGSGSGFYGVYEIEEE